MKRIVRQSPWNLFKELKKCELNPKTVSLSNKSTPQEILDCIESYENSLKIHTDFHLGYPYNLRFDTSVLTPLLKYSINNLGDPYDTSNYSIHSRTFEREVVDFFANLWGIKKDDYWGYVTNCGTEGNLHGMLLGREKLPNATVYSSKETHYSIAKACHYFNMNLVEIDTNFYGEMCYEDLSNKLDVSKDVIINANLGTTVKAGVDNVHEISNILREKNVDRENYYIHCDGALNGLILPYLNENYADFSDGIDSLSISGHKMLGSPMPCGIQVTRKEHVERLSKRIEYLNSTDSTIMGSRNGLAPIFMWYNLKKKGRSGIVQDIEYSIELAQYLHESLLSMGIDSFLNKNSTTVFFDKPTKPEVIEKWQLACENKYAHVVVMPNHNEELLDIFMEDLK